jgi:hypothetical protein
MTKFSRIELRITAGAMPKLLDDGIIKPDMEFLFAQKVEEKEAALKSEIRALARILENDLLPKEKVVAELLALAGEK